MTDRARARARSGREAFPIPGGLNLALTAAQISIAIALLYLACHAESGILVAAAVLGFAFVMQMGFSLIHEAEHDKLHPDRRLNDAAGILLAAIFPGSYQFMKVAHLSHHRKNRSDAELVDYIRPGDRPWVKRVQYYLLIHGLIWLGVPLFSAMISLFPASILARRPEGSPARGAALYLAFVREAGAWRVRAETAFTVLLWWALFAWLDLGWGGFWLAYGAFAFSWASQQYIYHVRSPRHLVEGAFNLKLWRPLELLYMNLPEVTAERPTQPYLPTYLRLWRPPEPVERAFPRELQKRGPLPRS
jgi:fatty acid desaturase